MATASLAFSHVSVSYGRTVALDDLSLTVASGEKVNDQRAMERIVDEAVALRPKEAAVWLGILEPIVVRLRQIPIATICAAELGLAAIDVRKAVAS